MKRFVLFGILTAITALTSVASADDVQIEVAQPATPAPPPASAPAPAPAPVQADRPASAPPRKDLWHVGIGERVDYVASKGFDNFADNNVLATFGIEGSYPLVVRDKWVLGVGASWGYASRSGTALRGDTTALSVHRLGVPIEGRYQFIPQLYGFAKVTPGAVAALGSLTDASAPNTIKSTAWSFATDISVGAAILVGPRNYDHEDKRTVRFWAVPEFGYGFATKSNLDLRPNRDASQALGTDDRTSLQNLNLSAFFWRISVQTTF
jgi:hypothetical protein